MHLVVLLAIFLASPALAGEVGVAQTCPRATEDEDIQYCQRHTFVDRWYAQHWMNTLRYHGSIVPRGKFEGPFMEAHGPTAPFVCTAVDNDGWCTNPFSAMARGE